MKINLTSVSKGSYVDIFADVLPEKDDKSGYGLVANAVTFSLRRLYAQDVSATTLLTLPVKEARQFARQLLAVTRQEGDVENEREKEIREQKELIGRLEDEIAVLKTIAQATDMEGSKDES